MPSDEKKGLLTETRREEMFGMKYSVTHIERQKNETVYAVFETVFKADCTDGYLIYKLDSAGKQDGFEESVLPIEILESEKYPIGMSFFSVGSKIYFCGGFLNDNGFTTKAFMFDTNSDKGTVSIQSMNYPKPIPLVFGPVDDNKVYVFSETNHGVGSSSFEMLDTSTNTWKLLQPPHNSFRMTFYSSALCGSNILISSRFGTCLFVFCTRSEIWREINYPVGSQVSSEPYCLPFLKARPIFHGNKCGHIFLGLQINGLPRVYASPYLPPVKNDKEDYDPVGHFQHLGEVESLMVHMSDGWVEVVDVFTYNDSLCIFCSVGEYEFIQYDHFSINICDCIMPPGCSLMERVNVKVVNSLQFKICSNKLLYPMHIHVVT